jgi:hypothetical protein
VVIRDRDSRAEEVRDERVKLQRHHRSEKSAVDFHREPRLLHGALDADFGGTPMKTLAALFL